MAQRILIADDDASIAELLATALAQEGYETYKTTQSLRYLDEVRAHHPHLVLLDLMMPYLDGRDELKLMSMDPETANIPVIIVTADLDAKREEDSFRALGVVEVVTKPFDLNALVRLVKQTIGEPRG
jgi:CheY-like chemotaxis protein